MSTLPSTCDSLLRMPVRVGEPYLTGRRRRRPGHRRQRPGRRLRRWLTAAVACGLTVFAVQVTVIGTTRAALYDEQEYLHYPNDWLDTIQIELSRLAPAPSAPAMSADDGDLRGGMELEPLPLDIKQYRVKAGDNLSVIARRFGLTLDTVASLNRTAGVGVHLLAVGELIRIPNQDGIYLPVGNDLDALSLRHGVLPETVLSTNRVTRDLLQPSTELFFPGVQHSGRELTLVIGVAFERPANGWVSSGFGPRIDPFTGRRSFHRGVDIAASRGTPVRATQGGRVAAVGRGAVLGNYIIVSHFLTGYSSLYGHLDRIYVRRGQRVSRGETVGRVGSTGRSTGPHLHFEIRRGNIQLNPAQLVPGLR